MSAPAQQCNENNGADRGYNNRTDAAKAIGKESEHTALSHARRRRGSFIYETSFQPDFRALPRLRAAAQEKEEKQNRNRNAEKPQKNVTHRTLFIFVIRCFHFRVSFQKEKWNDYSAAT